MTTSKPTSDTGTTHVCAHCGATHSRRISPQRRRDGTFGTRSYCSPRCQQAHIVVLAAESRRQRSIGVLARPELINDFPLGSSVTWGALESAVETMRWDDKLLHGAAASGRN